MLQSPPKIIELRHAISDGWPALMDAKTAARYVGERSVRAFRSRAGKVYPAPIRIPGRGDVWRKTDLDQFIARLNGSGETILDAADVL